MSGWWGDSRKNRESLDRHITGNDNENDNENWRNEPTMPCHARGGCLYRDQCEYSIPMCLGRVSKLDYDCMDALADIWQDCYRRDDDPAKSKQRALFLERVNPLLRAATAQPIKAG